MTNVRLSKTFEDFYILARLIILQSNLNYPDLDYLCFFFFIFWSYIYGAINLNVVITHIQELQHLFFSSIKQNTCTQTPTETEFVPLSKAVELTMDGKTKHF